jgi:hypothetical protein
LHPSAAAGDPPLYITTFTHAYELHLAAAGITLLRNRQSQVERSLTSDQIAGRQQILDIAAQLIIAERNTVLDEFCRAWQTYRAAQ